MWTNFNPMDQLLRSLTNQDLGLSLVEGHQ